MRAKVIFKVGTTRYGEEKIIECKAWGKIKNMLWFNKTSNSISKIEMSDKIVAIPVENVLYVEDINNLEEKEENAD
jgi:hypothetical protein